MKAVRKRKILGVATCFSFIFIFHILNFNNINITNSLLQLNGNGNSDVIINNPQRVDVIPNNAGDFFVFSTDNSLTKISCLAKECIESNQSVTSTQINSKYIDAKVIDNDIYLLIIIDEKTRQIVKSSFSGAEGTFSTETTVTFTFPDDSQVSSFCVAKDILFFVDSGKLLFFDMSNTSGAVELKDAVNSISVDFSGDYLYVINKDKTISFCSVDAIKNASKTTVSSLIFGNVTLNGGIDLANNPVNFLSNNIFTDSTGRFYKITGDETSREISILLEVDTSSINIKNCSAIFNFGAKDYLLCKTAENEASLFDLNDRLVKKYGVTLQGTEQITTICSSSENTLLVYKDKDGGNYFAKIIDANEDLDEESPSAPDDGQSSENTADEPTKDTIAKVLGPYDIDDENKYISKIDLGTTVAAFKQNLNLDGKYTVTFKNYTGKEITNGKLGTGSVVSFWKNGTLVKEYTVVVDFDVSGEGNFNSRDIDYMYNQIFDNGKTSLTGEYFISGDTNKDGVIDTVDLLYMKKAMASEK